MYKVWKKLFVVAIVLFFFWSLFLRFYKLGQVPTGLYWDEAAILLDAKSVAQTGMDMHSRPWYQVIYPSYGDYKLPVYIWLASLSVKLFGATELAVRLPSTVAGIVTILVSGFFVKDLLEQEDELKKGRGNFLPKVAGLFTALTVALSPWSILFSRTGFEGNLAQCFLAISIWCVVLGQKKKWILFLSPIFGLLATYTYFSARFVWIGVFVLLSALYFLEPKILSKKIVSHLFSVLAVIVIPLMFFFVGLLPMLRSSLYEASNTFRLSTDSVLQNTNDVIQSNVYREIAGNQRIDRVIFYRWWLTGKKLLSNYSDNMSINFLFVTGDPNLRHGTSEHGLYLVIFLPFFFIGWYGIFRRYPRVFILLVSWWLLALLPASVPNTTPHALRSLNALVPLSSVIGIGIAISFLKILELKSSLKIPAICIALLILVVSLFQFSNFYFTQYPILSTAAWQGGFKELAQATFSMRKGKEDVYVLTFDDRFYLWLLTYGPYSIPQVQSFPHAAFQIRDFDNVYTEHIPATLSKEAILVGSVDQVNQFVTLNNYQLEETKIISEPNQTQFEVAEVKALSIK